MIKHILKLIWNKKRSNGLILLEIFLSFLILFAVLSYVFYNINIFKKPLGFETKDRWMVYLDNMSNLDSIEVATLKKTLYRELKGLDRIESVSFGDFVAPISYTMNRTGDDAQGFVISSLIAKTDSEFAETYDVKIEEGRWFNEEDLHETYPAIVVNKKFMTEFFPGKVMLDSILKFSGEHRIVGVIEDYRYQGEFVEEEPIVIFQGERTSARLRTVHLKLTPNTPAVYEEQVNKLIADITKSSSFVIQNVDQNRKRRSKQTWIPMIVLLSICGFLSINVALGLFGVLVYNINRRKGEIGLRRAVGAHSTDISRQFVMEILVLTFLALIAGLFFAIQIPLFKIGPFPPRDLYEAIVASSLIIILIVLICAIYPSWQASRIDPATALHDE